MGVVLGIDLGSQDQAMAVSRENRMPRASVVITTAARAIIRLSKAGEKVESIAVWGSEVDPTLHPDFKEITGNLRDLRNKWFAKARLWLITEEPHFENTAVRHVLGVYDRVIARVEWGTAKTFTALTGRRGTELPSLFAGLMHLEHLVVQTRFVRGEADNSTPTEVRAWMKRLTELRPREVHVLNLEKAPRGKLKPVPKARLAEIAAEVTEKTGIPATVHAHESPLS